MPQDTTPGRADPGASGGGTRAPGNRTGLLVVLGALVLGVLTVGNGLVGGDGPPTPADDGTVVAPDPSGGPAPLPRAQPIRVRIPAIAVDARLMGLDVSPQGELAVPPEDRAEVAGWNTQAVTPGQVGTAVIVGHVDNKHGPAVFYELGRVGAGSKVEVYRRDGRVAVFTVYAVRIHPRADFPAERVYGNTNRPELRVITCGGTYDDGGYSGNVVAYARLTATRSP